MKISTTKTLAFAALMVGGFASSAFAAVPDPVTIDVTYENGKITKTNSNGTWGSEWAANNTDTKFVINVGVNNIAVKTSGNLEIYGGTSGSCTLSFLMSDSWYVSAYSFKATATTGMTITHNGKTSNVTASEPATVSETLTRDTAPSIVLAGGNNGITFNDFKVTLSYRDPADPALVVDEAPAEGTYGSMAVTNIVGDHFNTFTTWYHLLDNKNFLTGATLTDAGAGTGSAYDDEYLFCVVKSGEGYTLYNKAAGTATPVSGVVLASDKLTADGKELTARFAQKFVPVTVAGGSFTRTDGSVNTNMWQGKWTSTAEPVVTFFGGNNNMSTTDSSNSLVATGNFRLETGNNAGGDFTWTFGATGTNYISDYTFLATKNGTYTENTTITPNGGSAVALSGHPRRVTGSGYNDSKAASFVQNGTNLKGATLSDVYVTVRRLLINVCDRVGYAVFPDSPDAIQRIPALACIPTGKHAGRLVAIYDNRHNRCGDIGSGNISLRMAVSDDNGKTWSTPDFCRDAEGNAVTTFPKDCAWSTTGNPAKFQADPNTYWNVAFGDAAIVADRETGRLMMMAVGGPTMFFNGRYDKPNQCVRWTSEDGGETWSPAQRMTYKILDLFNSEPLYGKIDSQFIGSGRMMQSRYVKVGEYYRVYAVLSSQNNGGNTRNFVLYTDDFGENWAVLGGTDVCPVALDNGDECKTEELPDGSVLLAGRRRYGNRNFNIFRYTDATKGEGAWLTPVVTDMGFGTINACDGEVMVLPAKDNTTNEPCYLVLQSFPYGGGRNYVSIAYKALKNGADFKSPECFTTWEGRYRVDDGASVYSTMIWQNDNTLGFLYEDYCPNLTGMYLNFTLEEITDGKYSYQPDEQNRTAIELTKQLLEIRAEEADLTSKYVGQPVRSQELFDKAVDAYLAKPTYNGYMKVNKLEYEGDGVISMVNNGGYRIINAHNGKYSFEGDRYLSTDGTNLTAGTDENSLFKVIEAEGGYKLFNAAKNVYAANTPEAFSTAVPVTANADEAGVYDIVSNIKGESHFNCVNPGQADYPALHMDSGQNIVIWTSGEQASQWYMELVDAPEGYEPPVASEPEYDDYDFDYEKNMPAGKEQDGIIEVADRPAADVYYDLQGRRVAKPSHGIYITTDGRKRLF